MTTKTDEGGRESVVRFQFGKSVTAAYMIQSIFGRYAVLKRGDDGLYDAESWHTSQRKAEAALVGIVTKA